MPDPVVRCTADEGSWPSVDVSPHGRTLVCDMLGDLELRGSGLTVQRPGTPRRGLVALGDGAFHPVGAPSVRVDLSDPAALVLAFGGTTLTARRESA